MTRLEWGRGLLPYEQGVDQGVLYLNEGAVPWNGLVSVSEPATGSVETTHYYDGVRTYITQEVGEYSGEIQAYTYPDEFSEYNGYSDQHIYQRFGLCYRNEYAEGYQLHLVYNVLVVPTNRSWSTVADRPNPSLFNWDISAKPEYVSGARPAAHIILNSLESGPAFQVVEDILYGTDVLEPRLPGPDEVQTIYGVDSKLIITYHGDGTYTAKGDDEWVNDPGDGTFTIKSPSIAFIREVGTFQVSTF